MSSRHSLSLLAALLGALVLGGLSAALLAAPDSDGDSDENPDDNCIAIANGSQQDADGDGYGDPCDCDFDGDAACSIGDFNVFLPDFVSSVDSGPGTDMDGDGRVGIADFNLFLAGFQQGAPGPSGLVPDGDGDDQSIAGGDCDDDDASQYLGAPVVTDEPRMPDLCFEARGPNGEAVRDQGSDGCSADKVLEVLSSLGVSPSDPEAVKDDPLSFFTAGVCSAPFGNDGSTEDPRACELHDWCYTTCQQDRVTCDAEFSARMLEICLTTYPLAGVCQDACVLLATTYATAIALDEDAPYLVDQSLTCECCPDRSACGDGVCDITIGEGAVSCATDCEGAFADGELCLVNADCDTGFCNGSGRCGLSVCGDGVCGAGESCGDQRFCPADCGGCPDGNLCLLNQDCASNVCEGTCVAAGSLPPGDACINDAACSSGDCFPGPGFCTGSCGDGICAPIPDGESCLAASCQADCGACPDAAPCGIDADCASGLCEGSICLASGLPNGNVCVSSAQCASGLCNGGLCAAQGSVGNGGICTSNSACQSGICNAGFCLGSPLGAGAVCTTDLACVSGNCNGFCVQRCGDGRCDGTERCGGSNSGLECNRDCSTCPNGTICTQSSDCTSGFCAGVCTNPPSCTPNGGRCSLEIDCCSGRCDGTGSSRTCRACNGSGGSCNELNDCCSLLCNPITDRCV